MVLSLKHSGKGNAKLLLTGEHIIFYGHPALGLPLPLETLVTVESECQPILFSSAVCADIHFQDQLPEEWKKRLEKLFLLYCSKLDISFDCKVHIGIKSQIPIESGFGSSAALSAAFLRALIPFSKKKIDNLNSIAREGEAIFHGKSSGIDTGLALSDTPMAYYLSNSPDKTDSSPELTSTPVALFPFYLIAGSVPRMSSTKSLVESVHTKLQTSESLSWEDINNLGKLSRNIISLFQDEISNQSDNTAISDFGRYASQSHQHLKNLGVSHSVIDTLLSDCIARDASGGKISGAGGGGAFYIVIDSLKKSIDLFNHSLKYLSKQYSSERLVLNLYLFEKSSGGNLVEDRRLLK
jgi:mevalonate kinase